MSNKSTNLQLQKNKIKEGSLWMEPVELKYYIENQYVQDMSTIKIIDCKNLHSIKYTYVICETDRKFAESELRNGCQIQSISLKRLLREYVCIDREESTNLYKLLQSLREKHSVGLKSVELKVVADSGIYWKSYYVADFDATEEFIENQLKQYIDFEREQNGKSS